MTIIRDWFNIVTVKLKYDAQKTRDGTREEVFTDNREPLNYLKNFYSSLEAWSLSKKNCLSDLTFYAAKVITVNLVNVANELLDNNENINYVTFGAMNSDPIEGPHYLSGGNYYNSLLQFLQAEKKITD